MSKKSLEDFKTLLEIMKEFVEQKRVMKLLGDFERLNVNLNGSKREFIIGIDGFNVLNKIFDERIKKNKYIAYDDEYKYIKRLGELFLKELLTKKMELNISLVNGVVSKVKQELEGDFKSFFIYIPILFFSIEDQEEIDFDPITLFALNNKTVSCEYVNNLKDEKLYNAIACVRVKALSLEYAKERALYLLKAFLGLCATFAGCNSPQYLRTYYDKYPRQVEYSFYSEQKHSVKARSRICFTGRECAGWRNLLNSKGKYISAVKEVLKIMSENNFINSLGIRIFDSLVIYHEAVVEDKLFYKVPKLFSVIERLIFTETKKAKVIETIKERKELLFQILEETTAFNEIQFTKLYDIRSGIVHGSRSVIQPIEAKDVRDLLTVTTNLIGICSCFYHVNGINEQISDKKMDKLYEELKKYIQDKKVQQLP